MTPEEDEFVDPLTDPNAAACEGAAGELYALTVRKLAGTSDIPMCRAKGRVLLIVNGASNCGYTGQYKPLQELYKKHQKAGLSIMAFPSTSFQQEFTDEKQVSEQCTEEYGVTFPLSATDIVSDNKPKSGDVAQPVFKWIYAQPGFDKPVAWNFEKFLVGRDGKLIKRWLSAVNPDIGSDVEKEIETALAK